MTDVHQCSKVDFLFCLFVLPEQPLSSLLTFSNCRAKIVSSFFHSLSTAAFASGIFIAWGIGINFVNQIVVSHQCFPLLAMWSSWSFGRDDSRHCLVDSCAPRYMHALIFRGEILVDSQLRASVSWGELCFFVPFFRIHWNFQLFSRMFHGFFVFFRINK